LDVFVGGCELRNDVRSEKSEFLGVERESLKTPKIPRRKVKDFLVGCERKAKDTEGWSVPFNSIFP
jgi:hypothetical protein